MFLSNPCATFGLYPADLEQVINIAAGRASRERLAFWQLLSSEPTPAWSLAGLAAALGVAEIVVKDESARSSLGSFKVLGAPNALILLVMRRWPQNQWTVQELFSGQHAQTLRNLVVISATDGNHGRALAAAAKSLGCGCVIVLHAEVSAEREAAIAAFDAKIVRVTGDYDASVREAARLARLNGWEVVSDTSYEGYEKIPCDVMQGYGVIADELLYGIAEHEACPWTHVFVQGGVGAMPAAIISHFWEQFGAKRPRFIVVEPEQADCLFQSALQKRPARSGGTIHSVMAGLACGEASPLAWRFLQPAADFFITVTDTRAEEAMRTLAQGRYGDIPVVSGESGAAGLAALQTMAENASWRKLAELGGDAKVLLISTEGATAPGTYARIVGQTAENVLASRKNWLADRQS